MRVNNFVVLLPITLLAANIFSERSWAGVISISGAIQIVSESVVPDNILEGNWENDDFLRIFPERQNYMLPSSVTVDITNPGTYGRTFGFVPVNQSIDAGTTINSHYLHFDPIGAPGNMTRAGSVTFDSDVLGIIVGVFNGMNVGDPNNTLGLSNAILGIPRITYDVAIADLFLGGGDQMTLSSDRRSVSFLLISGRSSDNVRILTRAVVPEPERASATILIVAFLGLIAFRRSVVFA